jgi:hypothetical protein
VRMPSAAAAIPAPAPEPIEVPAPRPEAAKPPQRRAFEPSAPEAGPLLAEEVAALRRARQNVDRDPGRAIALLDDLDRRYPAGALREEAHVARILALCRLGRTEEARASALEFLKVHPGSVHTARVRASSGLAPGGVPTKAMTDMPAP